MPPQLAVAPDTADQTDDRPTHLKFVGMAAAAATATPPERGDVLTVTVTGRCVGTEEEERDDGELRTYRKVKVLTVTVEGIVKRAEVDAGPQLALDDTLDDD